MARRKDYLVRSLVASLALHAVLLSLQFGSPGLGLPWPSFAWNERKASVPTIQVVLRGQAPKVIPQQKITPDMAEPPPPRVATKAKVDKPPPVAPIPASPPDQPATMTASIGPAKVATPPPAARIDVVKTKEKRAKTGGSAVLSTDKEAQWSVRAADTAHEPEDESRDDSFVMEAAREEEARKQKKKELAEQRRRAQEAEEVEQSNRLDALASARLEEEKRNAEQAAQEKKNAEVLQRAAEARRKEEQAALAKAEDEVQEKQRAEALARAAALKAAEEAQERKRLDANNLVRLAEERRVEERAALAREEVLERKRAEVLARAAEEKQEQAALARAKEEALARAAQAEARAREQVEFAANNANANTNSQQPPAQISPAAERGAGSVASAMAGKPGGAGPKGSDMASRALAMARSGLAGLPAKGAFDTERSRRGSLLGRNPSDIQLSFYGDSWMQKVERIASLNYPKLSKNRLYGALAMTVSINSDGTLAEVRIVKSSGSKELDDAARRLVEISAPFSVFPPDLKRNYDVVDITRTLSFPEKPPLIFGQ